MNPDEDGYYFIDRPGDLFEIVLYFLRTSKLPSDLSDSQLQALQEESTYYNLGHMTKALQEYHSWKGNYPTHFSVNSRGHTYLQKPSEFITW